MSTCCRCLCCKEESSDDSDLEEEVPLPPGLLPVHNEAKAQETVPIHTPSASRECLLDPPLRERLRQPQLSVRKQLFSMTGWNLAIYPDMSVKGTREFYNLYAIMEVRAVGKGEVQIRGVDSGLFLAMSSKGKLYGEVTPRMAGGEDEGCRELERNDKGRNGCVSRRVEGEHGVGRDAVRCLLQLSEQKVCPHGMVLGHQEKW
ncbi:fibroblast growth factor 22 isoform X1 [Penaeus vannamei]|uniref:fibroblast growth factor 22 isoform X1 n=1 Tax=Penaeus vannamei TaxID=6689 RepID=UPI000F65E6E8|nr:fibroblast growth factor 10-like isoform X1 [Penaeus vannamei]